MSPVSHIGRTGTLSYQPILLLANQRPSLQGAGHRAERSRHPAGEGCRPAANHGRGRAALPPLHAQGSINLLGLCLALRGLVLSLGWIADASCCGSNGYAGTAGAQGPACTPTHGGGAQEAQQCAHNAPYCHHADYDPAAAQQQAQQCCRLHYRQTVRASPAACTAELHAQASGEHSLLYCITL